MHLQQLETFNLLSKQLINNFGFKTPFEGALTFVRDESTKFDLTITAIIHGNEVLGLYLVNYLMNEILDGKIEIQFNFAICLGNIEAFKKNQRCIDRDLNRSFESAEVGNIEFDRAKKIESILQNTEHLLDIHQTIFPTKTPFFIAKQGAENISFCKKLSAELPIVQVNGEFSLDGKTTIECVDNYGGSAVVLELGQMGYTDELYTEGVDMIHELFDVGANRLSGADGLSEFSAESSVNRSQIHSSTNKASSRLYEINYFYHHRDEEKSGTLIEGLSSFDDIKKGQVLGRDNNGNIVAKVDGKLIFPRYGKYQKASKELFGVLTELQASK